MKEEYKKWVEDYLVDTQNLDVSGFEHLQMLMNRDRIEQIKDELDAATRQILHTADRLLYMDAVKTYIEASKIFSFEDKRLERSITPSHWWWYLDVCNYMWNDVNG